jgi:hypothetical protein
MNKDKLPPNLDQIPVGQTFTVIDGQAVTGMPDFPTFPQKPFLLSEPQTLGELMKVQRAIVNHLADSIKDVLELPDSELPLPAKIKLTKALADIPTEVER